MLYRDFISPNILKLEMGLAEEIELSNAAFKVQHDVKEGSDHHRKSLTIQGFSRLSKILSSAFLQGASSKEGSRASILQSSRSFSTSFFSNPSLPSLNINTSTPVSPTRTSSNVVTPIGTSTRNVNRTVEVIHDLEMGSYNNTNTNNTVTNTTVVCPDYNLSSDTGKESGLVSSELIQPSARSIEST